MVAIVRDVDGSPVLGPEGEWELVRHCFSNERGNYRFSAIDPAERHAIAVVPADPEAHEEQKWMRSAWKARADQSDEEERFRTMSTFTSRGRRKLSPNDFSVFMEVPHDATSREKVVNLTVESQKSARSGG